VTLLGLGDPRWRDFVEARPDASLFHHPAWATLLADCYGYKAMGAALIERGGAVTAGVPVIDVSGPVGGRRWVSLPFTDTCGVLADDPAEAGAALVDLSRSSRLDAFELRGALPESASVQSRASFVRHVLPLTADPAAAWAHFRTNHRRSIRDAERAGVRITRGTDPADMEVFYRLHVRTRRRLGVPVQPRRFFRLLGERILQRGLGHVLTAWSGETPVASAIFSSWHGQVIYKYGARDERLPKLDANHLLFWTAIRSSCEEGATTFDLGRSDVDQQPLRSFKTGWGAREEPLAYSWIARAPLRAPSHRAERAMGVVIRNSAPWLCRAIGELLYKYAA
jgi:CelD/BcsL family acetyltransferase involved in cellulose biosynthesis